jgi:hypothetical protein
MGKVDELSSGIPRMELRKPIIAFLKSELKKQGGQSLQLTRPILTRLLQLTTGEAMSFTVVEVWLKGQTAVSDLDQFAHQLARRLPRSVDLDAAAMLGRTKSVSHQGDPSRIGQAISKSKSAETPDSILRMRDSQPKIEPSQGFGETIVPVPLARLFRITDALKKPIRKRIDTTPVNLGAAVKKVIKKTDSEALVPDSAVGKKAAGNYADAIVVAESLAFDLKLAHQKGFRTIQIKLGPGYQNVKDRKKIYENLKGIHQSVRSAMSPRPSSVQRVEVYFGNKLATVLLAD